MSGEGDSQSRLDPQPTFPGGRSRRCTIFDNSSHGGYIAGDGIYGTAFSFVMNRNRTQCKSTELRHGSIPDLAASDQQPQHFEMVIVSGYDSQRSTTQEIGFCDCGDDSWERLWPVGDEMGRQWLHHCVFRWVLWGPSDGVLPTLFTHQKPIVLSRVGTWGGRF